MPAACSCCTDGKTGLASAFITHWWLRPMFLFIFLHMVWKIRPCWDLSNCDRRKQKCTYRNYKHSILWVSRRSTCMSLLFAFFALGGHGPDVGEYCGLHVNVTNQLLLQMFCNSVADARQRCTTRMPRVAQSCEARICETQSRKSDGFSGYDFRNSTLVSLSTPSMLFILSQLRKRIWGLGLKLGIRIVLYFGGARWSAMIHGLQN